MLYLRVRILKMSFWGKIADWFGFELVRNRDEKGRFVADDKSTPNKNEAYKRVYKQKKKTTKE